MTIKDILTVVQILLATLIIVMIMLQNRGGGLGTAFNSDVMVFRARRGTEKLLLYGTVVSVTLFLFLSLVLVWL
jgi:protein translocase SecG subunit